MLERALRIYEEQLGREHSLYAYGLNNLASYYMHTAQYREAKLYYQSALELCKIRFGTESRNYQVSLRNYELASQLSLIHILFVAGDGAGRKMRFGSRRYSSISRSCSRAISLYCRRSRSHES